MARVSFGEKNKKRLKETWSDKILNLPRFRIHAKFLLSSSNFKEAYNLTGSCTGILITLKGSV